MNKFFEQKLHEISSFSSLSFKIVGLLPVNDKFLLSFHKENPIESSVDFMRVKIYFFFLVISDCKWLVFCLITQLWRKFDKDQSGYVEADELHEFVREMMNTKRDGSAGTIQKVTDQQVAEYSTLIVS